MENFLLEREKLEPNLDEDQELMELARLAGEKLKYTDLENLMKNKRNGFYLDKTLEELGIKPFKTQTVENYKKMIRIGGFWYRHPFLSRFSDFFGIAQAMSGATLLPVSAVIFFHGNTLIASIMAGGSIFLVLFGMKVWNSYLKAKFSANWSTSPLEYAPLPIPLFVIRSALRIKEKFPEAVFKVEHLNQNGFLIVERGDKRHYIEVWEKSEHQGS